MVKKPIPVSPRPIEGRTWKYYEFYLKRMLRNNRIIERILDIGCGKGLFLEACKRYGIDCIGVDISEENYNSCLERGYKVFLHNISKPMDFLKSNTFGAVFFNQVIEHLIEEAQKVSLEEIYRVLKKGGKVWVYSPCYYYPLERKEPTHISLLTPTELKSKLEEAGFTNIDLSFNYPRKIKLLPYRVVKTIWKYFKLSWLSQTAHAVGEK